MATSPHLLFHSVSGHRWAPRDRPHPAQLRKHQVAQPLLTSLTVNVSQTDTLLSWLDEDDARYITDLLVFVDVYYKAPSAIRWNQLFQNARTRCNESAKLSNLLGFRGPMHTGFGEQCRLCPSSEALEGKRDHHDRRILCTAMVCVCGVQDGLIAAGT
jgi:hypothetical protein